MNDLMQTISTWRTVSSLSWLGLLLLWESAAPYFRYFAGSLRERAGHGMKNFALGILNAVLPG